jgi:hypothetical protein
MEKGARNLLAQIGSCGVLWILSTTNGCQQSKIDKKKYSTHNPIKNWNNFLYGHKKIDSKYFEIEI